MRKHLLWYAKGWPGAKRLRDELARVESLHQAGGLVEAFVAELAARDWQQRLPLTQEGDSESRFRWDPKFEMDRRLDRGVGDDHLETLA
jgi:hypothetical protein